MPVKGCWTPEKSLGRCKWPQPRGKPPLNLGNLPKWESHQGSNDGRTFWSTTRGLRKATVGCRIGAGEGGSAIAAAPAFLEPITVTLGRRTLLVPSFRCGKRVFSARWGVGDKMRAARGRGSRGRRPPSSAPLLLRQWLTKRQSVAYIKDITPSSPTDNHPLVANLPDRERKRRDESHDSQNHDS